MFINSCTFFEIAQNSKGIYSTHTFRLKRPKAREPLGLVLVSGEKVSISIPVDRLFCGMLQVLSIQRIYTYQCVVSCYVCAVRDGCSRKRCLSI